ncbi:mRNA binding protein puf3 [Conoideocrella luteorostrata]|uniref:mRNA binding protein puf3 n=1 Tax=Conoideocrella luteorostrata TaxID=1105319 RepID=A0AAJ0CJP6_9HYPO|nr:mRNA binding protein puf3 [Conoideocrella luteorostrata]
MAPGSSDKPQQSMGSGFPGSSLYRNTNIWTSSLSNARERSVGSKDSKGSPSGSSALAANSEADVWTSSPWKPGHSTRSPSASPDRDAAVPNGTGYYEHAPPSAIGMKKGSFGGSKPFQNDGSIYASAFTSQNRVTTDAPSYMDSLAGYPQARDSSLPPSRQSQGSPAFQERYHGHTPNNSMHTQRAMAASHASSYSTHGANQRAFNLNKQIDEDLSIQFDRRVALDNVGSNAAAFNPASQPFQFNPGSQPWMAEASYSRHGGALELNTEAMPSQYNVMKRGSIDRVSPASDYRLQSGSSPRNYTASPDTWAARPPSRDPRIHDLERRNAAHQFAGGYDPSFYANQYAYSNLAAQYGGNFLGMYGQGQAFRPNMIPAAYNLSPVPSPYGMTANLPPIRPSRDQDPGKAVRSMLLDDYKASTKASNKVSKRWELKDIYGHIVEFAGDQNGSRLIQQRLETANSEEKEQVFKEIEVNVMPLSKDVFGNYVVQKLFEHGDQVQKKTITLRMKGKVIDLSVQIYGCRVVQKALEHVLVEQQAELTKELEPDILRVIRDQHGNHVVQKIIELVPRQYLDFLMAALRSQVTGLACHTFGCRVIQRMLEHGTEADKMELMAELHTSAQILITDQFGNYVAQHVIQNGEQGDRARMIDLVMAQLLTLSKHKFASNVVEKCIIHGTPEQRTSIRERLTTVGSDGTKPLQQMVSDQYGNYVVQKLIGQLQGSEREMLIEETKPYFFTLKKNTTGHSRQVHALESLLGLAAGGSPGKHERLSSQADANSVADTPALTNETSSPQSSSPRSTHMSTIGIPTDDGSKAQPDKLLNGASPQLREDEA